MIRQSAHSAVCPLRCSDFSDVRRGKQTFAPSALPLHRWTDTANTLCQQHLVPCGHIYTAPNSGNSISSECCWSCWYRHHLGEHQTAARIRIIIATELLGLKGSSWWLLALECRSALCLWSSQSVSVCWNGARGKPEVHKELLQRSDGIGREIRALRRVLLVTSRSGERFLSGHAQASITGAIFFPYLV